MDCVVLCGGKGTRLQPAVSDRPKSMAEVSGRPFLEWLLLGLRAQGIRRVILATGYRADTIAAYFGDGGRVGMDIRYSHEASPLGTGGAIRLALRSASSDRVLVLNGDSYCRVKLDQLEATHLERHARASLWLVPVIDCSRYGRVDIDVDGRIRRFSEKSDASDPGLVSAGVYLLDRDVVEKIPLDCLVPIETAIFPRLVDRGLFGVVGDGPLIDIGTPETYGSAGHLMRDDLSALARQADTIQKWRRLKDHLEGSVAVQRRTAEICADAIVRAADIITTAFAGGHKLLLCGNGGSAADCQHMATEFTSRLSKSLNRAALPALALTTDTSFLTAYANDCGFEGVFERQVHAHGRPGDVLIAISTSGNSPNVIRAVRAATSLQMETVGLLGADGALTEQVDCAVVVPSQDTQFVQESLLPVEHAICDLVEQALFVQDRIQEPLGAAEPISAAVGAA